MSKNVLCKCKGLLQWNVENGFNNSPMGPRACEKAILPERFCCCRPGQTAAVWSKQNLCRECARPSSPWLRPPEHWGKKKKKIQKSQLG